MSVFILETEAVTSAADGLSSIESSIKSLSDTINGYDTSQSGEDSFDFEGAKAVIASNVNAASIKVKNTQILMNNVVDSHTKLQKSLTSDDSSSSSKSSSSSGSRGGSNGGYSSGGYSSGGYSSGVGTAAAAAAGLKKKTEEEKDKKKTTEPVDVKDKIKNVTYVYPNKDKFSDESKELFKEVKYDENGYAKIGDSYVISADKSIGNVGDVVRFTKEDGTIENYIIGVNTVSDKYKNTISFVISEDKVEGFKPVEATQKILEKNTKIENCGNYKLLEKNNDKLINKETTKIDNTNITEKNTVTETPTDNNNVEPNTNNEIQATETIESGTSEETDTYIEGREEQ